MGVVERRVGRTQNPDIPFGNRKGVGSGPVELEAVSLQIADEELHRLGTADGGTGEGVAQAMHRQVGVGASDRVGGVDGIGGGPVTTHHD